MVTLTKIDDTKFEIKKDYKKGMRVSSIVYADDALIKKMKQDLTLEQAVNMALPVRPLSGKSHR